MLVIASSAGLPQLIGCVTLRNGTMHTFEFVFTPPGTTTTVLPDRLLRRPSSTLAASCAESMYAMFVALAPSSQACSCVVACVWFDGNWRTDPSALRSDRLFRAMIQPEFVALFRI